MSPKQVTFTRPAVLSAALELIRQHGWESLSARGLAQKLKSSVAPVYSAFGSMAALQRQVLLEARRLLDATVAVSYTDMPFLNIGVGVVAFARQEPNLFRALFLQRHGQPDILRAFHDSILKHMSQDAMLKLLSEASRRRLLENIWLYTLGLANSIIFDQIKHVSTEKIIRLLKDAGNVLIYAEAAGIMPCNSPENEAAWLRLMREKNIVSPSVEAVCPDPAKNSNGQD